MLAIIFQAEVKFFSMKMTRRFFNAFFFRYQVLRSFQKYDEHNLRFFYLSRECFIFRCCADFHLLDYKFILITRFIIDDTCLTICCVMRMIEY